MSPLKRRLFESRFRLLHAGLPWLASPLPPARLCELAVPISALSSQDEPRFWQSVILFIAVLVIYAPLLAGYAYLRDRFRIGSPAILQPAQIGAIELPMTLDWLNHQQF